MPLGSSLSPLLLLLLLPFEAAAFPIGSASAPQLARLGVACSIVAVPFVSLACAVSARLCHCFLLNTFSGCGLPRPRPRLRLGGGACENRKLIDQGGSHNSTQHNSSNIKRRIQIKRRQLVARDPLNFQLWLLIDLLDAAAAANYLRGVAIVRLALKEPEGAGRQEKA